MRIAAVFGIIASFGIYMSGTARAESASISSPQEIVRWGDPNPKVNIMDPPKPGSLPYVDLNGQVKHNDWSYVPSGGTKALPLQKGPDGKQHFGIRAYLKGPTTALNITAVSPRGEIHREKAIISFPGWKDWVKWQRTNLRKSKPFTWDASLGVSYIEYSDPVVSNFAEITLTPKVTARYWIKPRIWDINANVYFAALPLATSLNSVSARFLGVNLRAGYTLPWLHDPWSLDLMAGLYYSATFVSGSSFGYVNLLYPQFYPILRRHLNYWDSLGLYFKFVPMEQGLKLGLAQHEIATGLQWKRTLMSGHPLLVGLDYSDTQFLGHGSTITTEIASLTASIGYGF